MNELVISNKMNMSKYMLGFIVALSIFGFCVPARAFSVSPGEVLITINPGESQLVKIKIKNDDVASSSFKLGVLGIQQDQAGGPVMKKNIDIAEKWVMYGTGAEEVKGGQTYEADFLVSVPSGTPAGSHYLALTAESVSGDNKQISVKGKIASKLILQVAGTINEAVNITKWTPEKTRVQNKEWNFGLELQNVGTIEVPPMIGKVVVSSWPGKEVYSENIYLGNLFLSGSMRSLQPKIKINNLFLPGLYQAQVNIIYGRTGQHVSSMAYVWYLPLWSVILLTLTGIIILFIIIFCWKKIFVRRYKER